MASPHNISSSSWNFGENIIGSAFVLASYICFILPLSVYVAYLGFLQWKSKRTDASWSIGHSDFSTYNLVVMEFFGFAGAVLEFYAYARHNVDVLELGVVVNKLPWSGQLLFPFFTSVEHYLAVVRPLTYLHLKGSKGLRTRNIATAVVWLLSVFIMCYTSVFLFSPSATLLMIVTQMCTCLVAMVFCCVSVLHVLLQPKPGDQNQSRFDKSKRRSVGVIVTIMSMLLLRFVGNIVLCFVCFYNNTFGEIIYYIIWLNLSSSVVFFLLYLQRAGKLLNRKTFE